MVNKPCQTCEGMMGYPCTDYHANCSTCGMRARQSNYADPDWRVNGQDNARLLVRYLIWAKIDRLEQVRV